MTAFIVKSSLSLLLMFGLYWFLLRREKLFIFNRFFLIFSILFSLVIPFISISVSISDNEIQKNIFTALNGTITSYTQDQNPVKEISFQPVNEIEPLTAALSDRINYSKILLILYFSGVILLLVRFLRNIFFISNQIKLSEKITWSGQKLVLTDHQISPFCFFNTVFVNKHDYFNNKISKELLAHESEHIKQLHSIDVIFIELIQIIYWFNPLIILYNRAIRVNHEYLADNGVIRDSSDIKSYMDKLISFISCKRSIPLTSGSNHSFTRLRLMMMMKSRSGSFIYGSRIAITLCIVTVFFLLLSFKESGKQTSSPTLLETGTEKAQNIVRGIVLTEDGKPLISATINFTGTNKTSSEVLTGFDGRFTMNDIIPGTSLLIAYRGFKGQTLKADFTSEMVVRLVRDTDYKGRVIIPEIQNINFRNPDFTPAKALVIINGVITDSKSNFKVNPGEIKSFKVLTDKEATNKYGDKGKEGVVEIILNGHNTGSAGKNPGVSNTYASDSSKYKTRISVNHHDNKGETIDIPVANIQYVNVWTYHDMNDSVEKELRYIGIMTRDYFKVKGRIVRQNGKPLSGVKITASENPVIVTSDKEGRFMIEDVRENALLEFSLPGFKPYYLSTSFEVAYNLDLTIELRKENFSRKDDI